MDKKKQKKYRKITFMNMSVEELKSYKEKIIEKIETHLPELCNDIDEVIQLKVANNGWCTTSGRPESSILGHPRKTNTYKIVDFTHFFNAWQKQRFMILLMNKLTK